MISNINPLDVENIKVTLTTTDGDHVFSGKPTEGRSPEIKHKPLTVCRWVRTNSYGTFEIGDQIELNKGYTATCQNINKNGEALFLMDQVLPERVNYNNVNEYLRVVFNTTRIFDDVSDYMVPFKNGLIRIPYAEEIFGDLDFVVPSGKKQWPIMKKHKNRIAFDLDDARWYWLLNRRKDSASGFAVVGGYGGAFYGTANYARNVRPVFKLKL